VYQKNLILILARGLADEVGTAMFLVDRDGTLVYYNESAAEILGRPFGEVGELKMEEWARAFSPTDLEGRPLEPDELPLVAAVRDHRVTHRAMRIEGADGQVRDIAVTALPLFARKEEFVGALAIFWEDARAGGG
jgi:PAS domain-containing protein